MFKDDRICPTDFWNNDRVGLVLECLLWSCNPLFIRLYDVHIYYSRDGIIKNV